MATYSPNTLAAAQAAGMTPEAYVALRSSTLATASATRALSPSTSFTPTTMMSNLSSLTTPGTSGSTSTQVPTLTPMPSMPAPPTMPTYQPPSMAMPQMPTLQPITEMPFVGDAASKAAAAKAKATIANRKGRKSTFLTTTTRSAARPTIMTPSVSAFARKTSG